MNQKCISYCQAGVTCNDAEMHSQMDKLLEDTDQKVATLHDALQQAQLEKGHLTSMLAADKKAHTVALDALKHQVDHVHPKQIQHLHDKVIVTRTTSAAGHAIHITACRSGT